MPLRLLFLKNTTQKERIVVSNNILTFLLSFGNQQLLLSGLRKVIGFCFLSLLGPDTPQSGDGTSLTHTVEGFEFLEVVGKFHSTGTLSNLFDGHDDSFQLSGLLHVFFRSISLPGLGALDGEEDQLGLVLF